MEMETSDLGETPITTLFFRVQNVQNINPFFRDVMERKSTVRTWSKKTEEILWGCFEATDWISLCQPHREYINAMTDCVTDPQQQQKTKNDIYDTKFHDQLYYL